MKIKQQKQIKAYLIEEFGEKPINFETEEYGKVDSYGIE